MLDSLNRLAELPDDSRIYCAHEYTLNNGQFALEIDPNNEHLKQRMNQVRTLRTNNEPTIPTHMGIEKLTNPFLRCKEAGLQRHLDMIGASELEVFTEVRLRKDNF